MLRKFLLAALFLPIEVAIATPLPLDPHLCYIKHSDGRVVNLDRLCGHSVPPTAVNTAPTQPAPTVTTATPSRSSRCTYSTDRDSRGNLCGGRASVRRRGGK